MHSTIKKFILKSSHFLKAISAISSSAPMHTKSILFYVIATGIPMDLHGGVDGPWWKHPGGVIWAGSSDK